MSRIALENTGFLVDMAKWMMGKIGQVAVTDIRYLLLLAMFPRSF
jgi:hypothetical protein